MAPRESRSALAIAPRRLAGAPSRELRLADLLAKLARRAGTWGWLATYERVRRGETVPRWHRGMMELTAAKRRGELRPPEGVGDE